jgi:hypothetical protein
MNTKRKGDIGVVQVLSSLLTQGFLVSVPWGDATAYDLVVDSGLGKLWRVQVKSTGRRHEGALVIKTASITTKNGKSYRRTYGNDPVDFIIAYDTLDQACYVLPRSVWVDLSGGQIFLRLQPPKNGQKKRVHVADQYRNAWHLLRDGPQGV